MAAARAKEDELRAELKWRISEKSAAERAAAEVAARHELAKEARRAHAVDRITGEK